jgi:hypothetical protein
MREGSIFTTSSRLAEDKRLEEIMEEMACSPREPHVRQPGEKGSYESKRSSLPAPTILKYPREGG